MIVGTEWLIEAIGCDPAALRSEDVLKEVMSAIVADLGLKSIGSIWHKFPGEGGVTGLIALTESHLTCHTYPEYGTATFNLYCCRSRPEWGWEINLSASLGADTILVTRVERGNGKSQGSNLKFEIAGGARP